jgi:hypothetical protein
MIQTRHKNLIADHDNDCGLCKVACWPCPSPSNKGSLSLTGQESIWKNAFSFVAQQSLSLMKSRKKSRMVAKEEEKEGEEEGEDDDDKEVALPTSFLFSERK